MPIKYNYEGEGNCKYCGKPLKEAEESWGVLRGEQQGNLYGYKLYCSYRCKNDSYIQWRKEKNKKLRENIACKNCNKIFNGQRKDAKFCSTKCRVSYFRKKDKIL